MSGLEGWLSGLEEGLNLIPSTPTVSGSTLRGSCTLFWSLKARGVLMVHRHTCKQNTCTHFFKVLLAVTAQLRPQSSIPSSSLFKCLEIWWIVIL